MSVAWEELPTERDLNDTSFANDTWPMYEYNDEPMYSRSPAQMGTMEAKYIAERLLHMSIDELTQFCLYHTIDTDMMDEWDLYSGN